jgi:hypothetical protein
MCHNLIDANAAFDNICKKKLNESWVRRPICYFCIQHKALKTFLYHMEWQVDVIIGS